MHRNDLHTQRGQSIVIVAMAMIVLLIFGAFAVDLSFAYFQRRSMQNAADAAALAGARAIGIWQSDPTAERLTDGELFLVIQEYAARNKAKYVDAWLTGAGGVRTRQITPGSGATVPKDGIVGVEAQAATDFGTFFARVMGYSLISTDASACASCGAATASKYVSPIGVREDMVEVGEDFTLQNWNEITGHADTGWLALNCRRPSIGEYCQPTNPSLENWTTNGFPGVVHVNTQISGNPYDDLWTTINSVSPGDVLIVPVFNGVYHYTNAAVCEPSYIKLHSAAACNLREPFTGIMPVYTTDTKFEPYYYYNVTSFAALEVHSVGGNSVTGKFVPYSVEGDWINKTNNGVFVCKLSELKGVATQVAEATITPIPTPQCNADLAISITPTDDVGCGPYSFTVTVRNNGTVGVAWDVNVLIEATSGTEWVQSIGPSFWAIGELAPGQVVQQVIEVTPRPEWYYGPPTGPEVGAEIRLEARIVNENCRPEINENKTANAKATKADCGTPTVTPLPSVPATPTPIGTVKKTPTPTRTPTPLGSGRIAGRVEACLPEQVQVSQAVCERVPVDIVHVVDASWSMRWGLGNRDSLPTKMDAAKAALTGFNNMLTTDPNNPAAGDQVGVVSFDGVSAVTRSQLTTNVAAANAAVNSLAPGSFTPLVLGLQRGMSVLLSANHVITHTPILVLASDGLANVRTDGIRHPKKPYDPAPQSGSLDYDCIAYYGVGDSYADCLENPGYNNYPNNHPVMYDAEASAQAIDMANAAKAAGIEIFTIAIGTDFDPSVLEAIASPDTNGRRHFVAASASELGQIYTQIVSLMVHLEGSSACRGNAMKAAGAQVTISNGSYSATTTADEEGNFVFEELPSGQYTIQAQTVIDNETLDVTTDGPCGAAAAATVNVTQDSTFNPVVYLTSDNAACVVKPKLFLSFVDDTPYKPKGVNQPVTLKVHVEDELYRDVEGATVSLIEPIYQPLNELYEGDYVWTGGSYPASDICWTVEGSKAGYETGTTTELTDEDTTLPPPPPTATRPLATPTSTPLPTNTPTVTRTATPTRTPTLAKKWLTDWSGSLGSDQSICIYEPGWMEVSGTLNVSPDGTNAILQTSWYVAQPTDVSRCPAEAPNCNQPQYTTRTVTGDQPFTIRFWWPGIRPNDTAVQVHLSMNVLDQNGNPLPGKSPVGVDIFWYMWYCPAPTASPTPTATPFVNCVDSDARLEVNFVEDNIIGCGPYAFTLTVRNTGVHGYAKAVIVDTRAILGAQYVTAVEPAHWLAGDIPPGGSASTTVNIIPSQAWDDAAPGTEIKLQADVTQELCVAVIGQHDVASAFKGVSCDEMTATPTPMPTRTPTPTATPDEACLVSDADLAFSFEPPMLDSGCGPFVFVLKVTNTGTTGPARDILIDVVAIDGAGFVRSVAPFTWRIEYLPAGASYTSQLIVTPSDFWTNAAVGEKITLDIRVQEEECNTDETVGEHALLTIVRDEDACIVYTPTPVPTLPPVPTMTPTITPTPAPNSVQCIDTIYDGENTTYIYRVTSGGRPAISHWTLNLVECVFAGDVVRASEMWVWVNSDPTTGARGVKFDTGYRDNETRVVSVTFRGKWATKPGKYTIKGGTDSIVEGPVCAPACPETPTPTITPTATRTPVVTPFAIKINAGGSVYGAWVGDQNYAGGVSRNPGTSHDILGTTLDKVFQAYRSGTDFTYFFSGIPNGRYTVTLYFCEPWHTAAGRRKMHVYLQGKRVLSSFDIFAAVGHDRAITRTFTTTVYGGALKLRFQGVTDTAIISGIAITGQ